jgi:glutathione peroxidase
MIGRQVEASAALATLFPPWRCVMSKWSSLLLAGVVAACVAPALAEEKAENALNFKAKSISGKEVDLSQYKGKVVMIVNVASACGLTPQYEELQALHEQYADKGLVVLGFPCNQFGKQEPGSDAEIAEFCKANYSVEFPMFSKIEVNGENAHPLYKHLTSVDAKPVGTGKISWNFEKFILDRHGNVVARFAPRTKPDDAEVLKTIESELAKK